KGAIWAYTSSPSIAPSDSLRDFFFDNIHMITPKISHAPSIKYSAGQTSEAPVPGTIAHTMISRAPIPPIAGSQLNLETYGRSIFGWRDGNLYFATTTMNHTRPKYTPPVSRNQTIAPGPIQPSASVTAVVNSRAILGGPGRGCSFGHPE